MLNKIDILDTGSKANGFILYFDNKTIQIDAGIVDKTLIDKINKVYITHLHQDHAKYKDKFDPSKVVLPSEEPRDTEEFESFGVPHDVLNNGYCIKEENEQIVYIADCSLWYKIKAKFPHATYLFIECNWDKFRMKDNLINKQTYYERVVGEGGHLSNLDTLNLIDYLGIPSTCKIVFIHKSQNHTCPETFKIFDGLPNKWVVAEKNKTILCNGCFNIINKLVIK